jgi:hypothetical protein
MVASDVERLCFLDDVPVLLEVVEFVAVRGGEIGAETAVVSGYDCPAASGRMVVVVEVADCYAGFLICGLEDGGVLVFACAAEEDDRGRREDVLCKQ